MNSMSSADAQNKFGQLLEAAQRRPVAITRHGRPAVVVMSVEDYERRRKSAWEGLMDSVARSQQHAATKGLTEEKLEQLLADES